MTGSAEFCHCVHTKCFDRGTWTAFPSADCWMRRLSVFVTFAMPSGAPRLAEPFSAERPFSTGADVETEHGVALTCSSFVVEYFMSNTLNGAPCE